MAKLAQDENNLFENDEKYIRDLDILNNYIKKQSKVLALETGKPLDVCRKYVAKIVAERKITDISMRVLRKGENGDRIKDIVGFKQYLDWIAKTGNILAPNMITYASPDKIVSYSALFIHECINARQEIKNKKKRFDQLGDKENAYFAQLGQANKKFFNNSASGAGSSEHNALYYLTKHTSLTSGTRAETSSANAINEKLCASNRHYYSYEVTVDAIAYICESSNIEMLAAVAKDLGMVIPTAEQTFKLLHRSANMYWRNPNQVNRLKHIVGRLGDTERLAVCYVNDLNAMWELSPTSTRQFFDELIVNNDKREFSEEVMSYGSEDIYALVGMFGYEFMKGLSPKDLKEKNTTDYQRYVNMYGNTVTTLLKYKDFIQAFFVNDVLPQNIFEIPSCVRIAVPASDTDSSIYTTERIVAHYNTKVDMSTPAISAGAVTAFLSATMVAHAMLKLSRQINVTEEQKYRMLMKGEFWFPVLLCTSLTKHYLYLTGACEGNIYKDIELDTRGVGLKSSKLPPSVRDKSMEWYDAVMRRIMNNERLTPRMVKAYPAYLEHLIANSIKAGETTYFSSERINERANYKNPDSSNWQYATLWNSCFANKYGEIAEFPVTTIKVPANLDSLAKIMVWVETLEPAIRDPFKEWLGVMGKKSFTNILVPHILLPGGKLPKEFIPMVNIRGLLNQNIAHCYTFMTTLDIHVQTAKGTKLASDEICMEEAKMHLKEMGITLLPE